jgi:mannitol/fructose-specific phosphotransferase system IIA component (Ntr-type)
MPIRLRDFLTEKAVKLRLEGSTPDAVLSELVGLIDLDGGSQENLLRILKRREELGSTGIGRGVAIPHGRSPSLDRLQLAFGHLPAGMDYHAIDNQPVYHFFLILAPPVAPEYLPVLSRIAQLAKEPDVPERLSRLQSPEELFQLLDEKGV